MRKRKEVVEFIEKQFRYKFDSGFKCTREKGNQTHYGKQELRELLDFVYNKTPKNKDEEINNIESLYSNSE